MDYQIVWSSEALDDIDAIAEYHQKTDPLCAQAPYLINKIIQTANELASTHKIITAALVLDRMSFITANRLVNLSVPLQSCSGCLTL